MKNIITELKYFQLPGCKLVNIEFENQVTFITGSNGSGKSDLLQTIESDNLKYSNFVGCTENNGYYDKGLFSTISEHYPELEKIINKYIDISFSSNMDKYSDGQKRIINLIMGVYFNSGTKIFLIDEPETSLHITWQRTLVEDLIAIAPNAQFIIATHSPSIIGKKRDCMISLDDDGSSGNAE